MNLGRKITLYLLLCIGLCGVAFAQPVDIPDQNLEQAIRETLELPANAPLPTTIHIAKFEQTRSRTKRYHRFDRVGTCRQSDCFMAYAE